ncbi:NAD(+)/NADH kinase [Halolamina sp.]|jgi:NAD+ kinase|uniref:NAD(+)/NADH kinase n=1 Tax=Halolamina sp. TaxID=1940283 RepID=UPI000223BAF6|nr:ATP-NAD/AcoX kinase [halophilic archaeon DL31]
MTEPSAIRRVAVRGAEADVLAETDLEPADLADADAVIAVGESALTGAALAESSVPLLPVGVDGALHGISRQELPAAAASLSAAEYHTVTHPVLAVEVGGEQTGRAVLDVTLLTTEPARISEYSLTADGEQLTTVRADGVVVAGSFGSAGYNNAAGGPLVAPGAGLSVVPVAPFTTRANGWMVPGPLELQVERDEGAVSLYADAADLGPVSPADPVRVRTDGRFDCLRPSLE